VVTHGDDSHAQRCALRLIVQGFATPDVSMERQLAPVDIHRLDLHSRSPPNVGQSISIDSPGLIALLRSNDSTVREWAAIALASLEIEGAVEPPTVPAWPGTGDTAGLERARPTSPGP
jgi:hypothetical protein